MKQALDNVEIQSIETIDGEKLILSTLYVLQGWMNYGATGIEYETVKGYRQHGSTVRDFQLEEREITVQIISLENCTREQYWAERQRLLNIFRPNRGDINELTLTIRYANGTRRSIRCHYTGGLEFSDGVARNDFRLDVTLRLRAFNPIWYDTDTTIIAPSATVDTNLIFPITFPIIFGTAGAAFVTPDLDYQGTWRAYPTITIQGPYLSCRVINTGTLVEFNLLVAIGQGEQRIIRLSETGFFAEDALGNSVMDELDFSSNLIDFFVAPSGEFEGTQTLQAILSGGIAGISAVTFEYNTAYYGI